jgi:hypothetical protein
MPSALSLSAKAIRMKSDRVTMRVAAALALQLVRRETGKE